MNDDVTDAFPEPDDAAPPDEHQDDLRESFRDDLGEDLGDPDVGAAQDAPDLSGVAPAAEIERTGNPVVDSVLDSLRELDQVPVSEHVGVFEAAHDRLRGALADAGDPPLDS